jgi:hypothetical protein
LSFNGKLGAKLLDGEIFSTPKEAQMLIEGWRREYGGYPWTARWEAASD